jgi:AraC family transcriptional regulator
MRQVLLRGRIIGGSPVAGFRAAPLGASRRAELPTRDSMIAGNNVYMVQGDGLPATALSAGRAPGQSGVSVLRVRFEGGVHFSTTLQQHLVCFHTTAPVRIECRIAGRALYHEAPIGSLAVLPAGADSSADTEESFDALLVEVDAGRLALATAENEALEARLIERTSGLDDKLLGLARALSRESEAGFPNGPLFWNEGANSFIDSLIARHTSAAEPNVRGMLGRDVLERLKAYVVARLDEPIEVAELASIAGRSPFHFSRVFARGVGMTPHRYVVHLRLQRAIELVREGRSSLAEIAARTGFADQSHLSRWVRRVHGVSLTQLAAPPRTAGMFKIGHRPAS